MSMRWWQRPKYTKTDKIFNLRDKAYNTFMIIDYMLDRTQSMFHYGGLPKTLPQRILELFIQTAGHCAVTNVNPLNGKEGLYAFVGGPGGEPDIYYRPTKYVVANPQLRQSLELVIDKDCVVIPNDSLFVGLLPMFSKYATLMSENELSMQIADIILRIQAILTADDDATRASAQLYLDNIEKGKLGIIANSAFLEGLKVEDFSHNSQSGLLSELIEYQQYLKASLFNEIGLDANYNMKREAINSNEAQMNDDALLPLVDDMLRCRQEAVEKINDMFGTEITVELASSWRARQEEEKQIIQNDIADNPDDTIPEEEEIYNEQEQEESTGENQEADIEADSAGVGSEEEVSTEHTTGTDSVEITVEVNVNTDGTEEEEEEKEEESEDDKENSEEDMD